MNNKELGKYGEDLACKFLIENGFEIFERNKHFSKFCEIDIIAKDRNTLVFVEVKTRKTNSCGSPLEAVTPQKLKNLKIGISYYLMENTIKFSAYRLDVIAITLTPKLEINHLKNVS